MPRPKKIEQVTTTEGTEYVEIKQVVVIDTFTNKITLIDEDKITERYKFI